MSAALASLPNKLPGFEAARFVAAFFVVWIHGSIGGEWRISWDPGFPGRFAVPFFVISSVFFSSRSVRRAKGGVRYVGLRIARIIAPFFAWSGLYIALKYLQGRQMNFSLALMLDGGSYQLWFLPYILVITILFAPIQFWSRNNGKRNDIVFRFSLLIGLLLCLVPSEAVSNFRIYGSNAPKLWMEALPAAFFGMALAHFDTDNLGASKISLLPSYVPIGFFILFGCAPLIGARYSGGFGNIAGASLAVIALHLSIGPAGRCGLFFLRGAQYGSLSFGIYLSHILFIGPARALATYFGVDHTLFFAVAVTLFAFAASAALTKFLISRRYFQWLV